MADDGEFESPLDELFVEGARFHEPSAAERKEWAKASAAASTRRKKREHTELRREQRQGRLRVLWPVLLLGALTVAFYLTWGRNGGGSDQVVVDAPDTVQVVYAVPSDVTADDGMPDAIRNELAIVDAWFREQADGHAPRYVFDNDGNVEVEVRDLEITAAELADRADAMGLVADEFRVDGQLPTEELLLIFVPVEFQDQVRCGEGGAIGLAVIWVGSCDVEPSTTTTEFGFGTSFVVAHELTHAMGAVPACAPHYGRNGHVVDDPTDLMYEGDENAPPDDVQTTLDPGHDDYYDHGVDDCFDVQLHPAWD